MSIATLVASAGGVACDRRAPRDRPMRAAPAARVVHDVLAAEAPGGLELRALAVEPAALGITRARGLFVAADVGAQRILREIGGAGARFEAPRPPESTLRFVAPLGDRPVLVALDRQAELDALSLGGFRASGEYVGPERIALGTRLVTQRRASSAEGLLVAYAGATCPVQLVAIPADAIAGSSPSSRATPTPVALERCRDELGREVIAADGDARGFAVLFRRGVPEDAAGAVVLATERGSFAIEALHDLGLLESFERLADRVVVVGSFEFDRPRAFLFDLEGRLLDARRLAPGDACPFGTPPPRVEVEAERDAVRVTIRDPSGDVRATRSLARADGSTPPVVARDGDGFAVAFTTRAADGWAVRVVRLGPGAEVL